MTEQIAAALRQFPGVALPGFAAIEFYGPETENFLQGQLTFDVEQLKQGRWSWGGHCSQKGRLQCTFLAWRTSPESITLAMAQDIVQEIATRLGMYKMRAKTQIATLDTTFSGMLEADSAPPDGEIAARDGNMIVGLGEKMALVAGSTDVTRISRGEQDWLAEFARRGSPWISSPVKDQLIPQMASLDLAGGVSFVKGCYVGQEIVSRIRHRGRIKKRAFILRGDGDAPAAGIDVFSAAHGTQSVGQVMLAAKLEDGFVGTGSIRLDAAAGQLTLPDGRAVSCSPPPYGLEERTADIDH